MSVKNKSQLISDVETFLPDNTNEEISAQDERDRFLDLIDSTIITQDFFVSDTSKYVAGDGTLQDLPAAGKTFTLWNNITSYVTGDTVLNGLSIWLANADNINEEPGTGVSWQYQGVSDDTYSTGYTGSILAITQNRFRQIFEDFKTNTLSVSVVDFGATGDGTTDDTAAIQAAIDTNQTVFLPTFVLISGTPTLAEYLISENLIVNDSQKIYGNNTTIKTATIGSASDLTTAFNFFVCGSDSIIEGIYFKGTGKTTYVFPWTTQNAIWHKGYYNQVINCRFKDLNGTAVLGVMEDLSGMLYNKVVNPLIDSCTVGIFNYVGAEYQTVEGGHIINCDVGINEFGANNTCIGVHVDFNHLGLSLKNNGANSDHGSFVGGSLNHNDVALNVNGLAVGYLIDGTNIFDTSISISEADKLIFNNCAIYGCPIVADATTTVKIVSIIGGYQGGGTTYAFTGTANLIRSGIAEGADIAYKIYSDVNITGDISATNLSGTNTGDQTTVSGNAGTATALQTARTINGVSFNGTSNITIPTIITSGSFSGIGTATTTFTVTIGSTQANNNYRVPQPGALNILSAAPCYITNKTTTTFDVVYISGLTGTVAFDWVLAP